MVARVLNIMNSLWTLAEGSIMGHLSSVAVLSSLAAISDGYCVVAMSMWNYWSCKEG